MNTRIDWSTGPRDCADCGARMRPTNRTPSGMWKDTVEHADEGRCFPCYQRRQRQQAAEKWADHKATNDGDPLSLIGDGHYVFGWELITGHIPMHHQVIEAYADLADALRDHGLILATPVKKEVRHGETPVLLFTFTAIDATPPQARALHHPTILKEAA